MTLRLSAGAERVIRTAPSRQGHTIAYKHTFSILAWDVDLTILDYQTMQSKLVAHSCET